MSTEAAPSRAPLAASSVPRPPTATYRLQLRSGLDFGAAAALVPYVARLGASHLYLSPVLQAAPGSSHGYDVVDPTRADAALGGETGLGALADAARTHGLGLVLDIVPNHMAAGGPENPWFWDVLENGPSSRFAGAFDVDWEPPESYLRHRILLPILGDHYGRVLEAGELRLERDAGAFRVRYHDHLVPIAPRSLDVLLDRAAVLAGSDELAFLADAAERLPSSLARDRASVARRHRDKEVLRRRLGDLAAAEPDVRRALDVAVAEVNADPDALDALLERQNYRLARWRAAERDLGYRRFFDVASLIGIRVEDEAVFQATHETVLRWTSEGRLDGLRVDHPDGLRDPAGYLRRLRAALAAATGTPERSAGSEPDDGRGGRAEPWLVVEKILQPDEELRPDWPVAGTTGYEFLRLCDGLFVDPAGRAPLVEAWRSFTGATADLATAAREARLEVLHGALGSELNRLTGLFLEVCERHRRHRDHTRHDLHEALREVAASYPVYRTYVVAERGEVAPADRAAVEAACATATAARPDLDADLFDFLRAILLLEVRGEAEAELAMRVQQLTGAVMAKGVEDTAFYRWTPLSSLDEVGGDPSAFGVSPTAFHAWAAETQARHPATMLTLSTHDTKRSLGVRARLGLLSERPAAWTAAARRWAERNERHRRDGLPDRAIEWLLYQALVGAWPLPLERALAYAEKAAREAATHTSWAASDPAYEAALRGFLEGLDADADFQADLASFVEPLVGPGRVVVLAETLIQLAAPGVPDVYMGSELWDASLVDPDNRRPVDLALRERLLAELAALPPERAAAVSLERADEGLPRLWLTHRTLALRRRRPASFGAGAAGAYRRLAAEGAAADHVLAFVRGVGAAAVVAVVPRLVLGLDSDWLGTRLPLPAGRWRDELTGATLGGTVPIAELLGRFPVALLAADPDPGTR